MEVKRETLIRIASLLAIVGSASAAMLAVRIHIVEPEPVALACAGGSGGWRCVLREYAVQGFLNNAFGIAALIAGIVATVSRWRWLALIAMLSGVAGAVLYTFELSGAGLLLGALVWVRRTLPSEALSAPVAEHQ